MVILSPSLPYSSPSVSSVIIASLKPLVVFGTCLSWTMVCGDYFVYFFFFLLLWILLFCWIKWTKNLEVSISILSFNWFLNIISECKVRLLGLTSFDLAEILFIKVYFVRFGHQATSIVLTIFNLIYIYFKMCKTTGRRVVHFLSFFKQLLVIYIFFQVIALL